jgi:hypothetical protein
MRFVLVPGMTPAIPARLFSGGSARIIADEEAGTLLGAAIARSMLFSGRDDDREQSGGCRARARIRILSCSWSFSSRAWWRSASVTRQGADDDEGEGLAMRAAQMLLRLGWHRRALLRLCA